MAGPPRKPGPGPWRLRPTGFQPQSPGSADPPPIVEDGWDWSDDGYAGPDFSVDSYFQTDQLQPNQLRPVYEDPWHWFTEDETQEETLDFDGPPVGADAIDLGPPDVWDHWADETDEETLDFEGPPVGPDAIALPVEDAWDWDSETAEESETFGHFTAYDAPPIPAIEDAWDWFAQDEDEEFLPPEEALQPPPIVLLPPPEDAWPWADDEYGGPDWSVDSYQQSSSGASPASGPITVEDAWPWADDDYGGPDWSVDSYLQADFVVVVVPNTDQQPEDAWQWWDDEYGGPDYSVDSYQQVDGSSVPPNRLQLIEDVAADSHWDDDPEDFFADHFTNYDAPPIPALEDPWDWDAEQNVEDEWIYALDPPAPISDVISPPIPEDGWDWSCDYEETDDYETDLYPQMDLSLAPQPPEDPYDFDLDAAFDDDLWQLEAAQVTPPNAAAGTGTSLLVRRQHVFVTEHS